MSPWSVTTRQQRFTCVRLPGPHLTPSWTPFHTSLTTTVFSQRSTCWFRTSPRRAVLKGLPSSLVQHRITKPRLHVSSLLRSWHNRTPDKVQELMCGQRQAPTLHLASRGGRGRRVVECLPETVDGDLYRDAGRGGDPAFPPKTHHLLLSVPAAILDGRIRRTAGRARGMPSEGRIHVRSPGVRRAPRVIRAATCRTR